MNQIDVVGTRLDIVRFLSGLGWKPDSAAGANFVNGPLDDRRSLEFKIGTSYGEVAIHVRQGREITETIRIVSVGQIEAAKERINDLACDSDREVL